MARKISMIIVIFVMFVGIFSTFSNSYAVTGNEVLKSTQATELVEIKETTKQKLGKVKTFWHLYTEKAAII